MLTTAAARAEAATATADQSASPGATVRPSASQMNSPVNHIGGRRRRLRSPGLQVLQQLGQDPRQEEEHLHQEHERQDLQRHGRHAGGHGVAHGHDDQRPERSGIERNTKAHADTVATRWPASTRGNIPTSGCAADAALYRSADGVVTASAKARPTPTAAVNRAPASVRGCTGKTPTIS